MPIVSKLTKRVVDSLVSDGTKTGTLYWDTELAGFGVRVSASGAKKFIVKYRTESGRQRWLTLGAFGPLTCDRARDLARIELAKVIEGADPAAERRAKRDAVTVAQLCDLYLAAARNGLVLGRGGTPKKQSTIDTDESRIKAQIKPLLGSIPASEVGRPDIEKFKADVMAGKAKRDVRTKPRGRSIVTGGLGAATRTLGLLGAIYTWGIDNGYVNDNPVRGVRRFAYAKREALLTGEQYHWLGITLDYLAAQRHRNGRLKHHARGLRAIRFIACSGLRLNETANLRWVEVDQDGRCLGLGNTKTGFSLRPLGRSAYQFIADLDDRGSEFVFPCESGGHGYRGLPKLWLTVKRTARRLARDARPDIRFPDDEPGPLDRLTLHSLRHSYAGMAESLGATIPTIGALLGHSSGRSKEGVGGVGGVTGGYILKRLDRSLVAMADRTSKHIVRAMRGEKVTAEVISFRPRATPDRKSASRTRRNGPLQDRVIGRLPASSER
ncbi:tyrosine-type recombinase/integrase [Pseudochelatococcus sp. B33]